MAHMINSLIKSATGAGAKPGQKIGNVIDSAQLGWGSHIPYLDGATPGVLPPVQIVVTSAPTIWNYPGYEYNKPIFKALMERSATNVSGIDFGYTLNTGDSMVGLDGQQLGVPLNTTRSQVSPSFTFPELNGNLVWNFFYKWITDIQDPDTHASLMTSILDDEDADKLDYLISTYSASFVAIQFDPTFHWDKILDCAFYAGVFPTETGDIGFERQINTSKHPERTIPFRAVVQHNANTRELGKYIAKALNLHKPNYDFAPTAQGISVNLESMGLDAECQQIVKEFTLQGKISDSPADYTGLPQYNEGESTLKFGEGGKAERGTADTNIKGPLVAEHSK